GRIASVRLTGPEGIGFSEKAGLVVEHRVEIELVQDGMDVTIRAQAEIGALRNGHSGHVIIESGVREMITGAEGESVAHKLVQDDAEGFLLKIERLPDAGGLVQEDRPEGIERPNR